MHFIRDTAVTREIGEELTDLIERAVLPLGDCSACGQRLGEGTLRLTSTDMSPMGMVLVTVVHASCGTADLQHGAAIGIPGLTWNAAGIALPVVQPSQKRTWYGKVVDTTRTFYVPCVIVGATCDVFLLGRSFEDGALRTPVEQLFDHDDTWVRLGEVIFDDAASPHVRAEIEGGDLQVSGLGFSYRVDFTAQLRNLAESARGILLAVTHEPIGSLIYTRTATADEKRQIAESRHTAYAWIPSTRIVGLNAV